MSERFLSNIISILNKPLWSNKNSKQYSDLVNNNAQKEQSRPAKKTVEDSQLQIENFVIISSLKSLEKLKLNHNLNEYSEQQRYYFLETYQKLRTVALHCSDLADNPDWQIDNWEIDVKIVLLLLTKLSCKNKKDIQNILWLSPQVRRLKLSLSANEYDLQAFEYVERVYQWAEKLQQAPIH
ncbi:MAG: hypothetical protein QNJ38_23130 [Prochloraceae cyanobacterium]|nr:hypothetical protein [Prochloraceae cyanobacterium]